MTASAIPSSSTTLPSISAQRPRYQPPERQRDPRGDRYNRAGAYAHGAGVGRPARKASVDTMVCAIPDPLDPGKRLQATVNRRVDVLEMERSHNRISVSEYEVGRQVQAIFERASGAKLGSGGWDIAGSRDQTVAHELQIIYTIEDARLVVKLKDKVVRAVGTPGARFLHEVLTGRKTFGEFAEARGKSGERGATAVGNHFRILMGYLDEAFAAQGSVENEIRAFQGERTGEETDARGKVVPARHGQTWGTSEARYAPQMNDAARALTGRTAKVRDRVGARHRVVGDA